MSGTGSVGATIRLYLEKYEPGNSGEKLFDTTQCNATISESCLSMSKLTEYTGREANCDNIEGRKKLYMNLEVVILMH